MQFGGCFVVVCRSQHTVWIWNPRDGLLAIFYNLFLLVFYFIITSPFSALNSG